tara:strand:- start:288 stop:506 length:219 start_codon:yes stop_codon:yes gene_type:complete
MSIELLTMNGYGQFVWPAFIFTFASCLYLYLKVRIEFKQLEKIYLLEFREAKVRKIQFNKRKKSREEALPIN